MGPPNLLLSRIRGHASWHTLSFQQQFVRQVLEHPTAKKFPPQREYTSKILRMYVDMIEKSGGTEFDDDLMEMCAGASAGALGEEQLYHFRTFFVSEEESIALKLSKGFGGQETGGTGVCLWEAGLFLSEFVRGNMALFSGKRVLELGAGNGVAGICLARLQEPPDRIILTDHSSRALELLEENLRVNDVDLHRSHRAGAGAGSTHELSEFSPVVSTAVLDWETCMRDFDEAALKKELHEPRTGGKEDLDALGDVDVILGADVTFDPRLITALLEVISYLFNRRAAVAYLAATVRSPEMISFLCEEMSRLGMQFQDVAAEAPRQDLFGSYALLQDARVNLYRIEPGS